MSAVAHCAVMRNPFSTAVAAAKIPDGSAVLSGASRLSHSKHYSCEDGTMFVALYPGFHSHVFVAGEKILGTSNSPNFVNPSLDISSRNFVLTNPGSNAKMTCDVNCPQKFRVASQGCRISLIENSENNDGWFEAIRIPAVYTVDDFVVTFPPTIAPFVGVGINPIGKAFGGVLGLPDDATTQKNWSMNPTYITGKLRDINKHTFTLHRENDYDWVDLPNVAQVITNDVGALPGALFIATDRGTDNWWVDRNLDTVLIRMYASTAGSTTAGGFAVHIHTVQHVEEQFEPDSEMARYMIKPPSNPALTTAVMNTIRREIKPSLVRMPTGAVSVKFSRQPRTYRRRKRVVRRRVIKRRTYRRRR